LVASFHLICTKETNQGLNEHYSNHVLKTTAIFCSSHIFTIEGSKMLTSIYINLTLKMLCLYLLVRIVHILYFNHILAVKPSYSHKYEKLPNVVTHTCSNIIEKINLLKMWGPQIWLCLFTFRAIALKQLNSSTTINTFS